MSKPRFRARAWRRTNENELSRAAVPTLRRYFGVWSLFAIGLNTVVGGGFFLLPGIFFGHVGAWTPWLILLVGLCLIPVGLCFAEVSSRFDGTGGPYLYTREAYGRFAGFQMSWLLWVTRIVAHASVLSALTAAIGYLAPTWSTEPYRSLIVCSVTAMVMLFNILGTREASWFLSAVTVIKFTPVVLFVVIGLFFIDASHLAPPAVPVVNDISAAALVMVFALSGFEMLTVPAGEAKNPSRHVPRAIIIVIATSTLMMAISNVVTIGMLDRPDASQVPIVDAAGLIWGTGGAVVIALTMVVAAIGHNMSSLIVASRILYGMGEKHDLPAFFGELSTRLRTPVNAIGVTAVAILILAITNSYETLAAVTAMTRLLIYVVVAGATLQLRRPKFKGRVSPPRFVSPLPTLMPWLVIIISVLILLDINQKAFQIGGGVLLIGTVFFLLQWWLSRARNVQP